MKKYRRGVGKRGREKEESGEAVEEMRKMRSREEDERGYER